jgi:hypothetical protein
LQVQHTPVCPQIWSCGTGTIQRLDNYVRSTNCGRAAGRRKKSVSFQSSPRLHDTECSGVPGAMPKSKLQHRRIGRREFIALGAAGLSALALRPALARELGDPRRPYGERSPFEQATRTFRVSSTPGSGSSRTPLQELCGTVTPSSLHFERHHSGVPKIDPNAHELLLDGLVERPLVFTLKDLKRFPSVSLFTCLRKSGSKYVPSCSFVLLFFSCSRFNRCSEEREAERQRLVS